MKEKEYSIDVKKNENIGDIIHEDNMNLLNNIIKGIITGFLIAYLIILGLRPAALYPDNILEIIENPWIFIILIIINFYIIQWDLTIGLLLFLSIIALLLDIIIFTEGKIFFNKDEEERYSNKDNDKKSGTLEKSVTSVTYANNNTSEKTISSIIYKSYKDINDIIFDKIEKYKKINNNKNTCQCLYIIVLIKNRLYY
jgi:ABC-type multidrug transport system fused ATPase/permease subunit